MNAALFSSTNITFAPAAPWPVLAALALAATALLILALWRGARGVWWRALLFVLLGLLLTNPSLVEEQRQPIKDVAVVVVDRSPSQKLERRTERADLVFERLRHELGNRPDIDLRVEETASGDAASLDETHLFSAWNRAVADLPRQRLAATFLVTDGQVHDVPRDLKPLTNAGPIHLLLTGQRREFDRRLTIVQAPSFGLVGKNVRLTIRVDDPAERPATDTLLTLHQDGGTDQKVLVPVGRPVPVDFQVAHGGQNVLEMSVPPYPFGPELTDANNHAAVVVNGVRDHLKVLLVSGEPHAGERTWRNLLKADPAVDLVHFTILRPPEKQDGTPIRELSLIAFPVRELFEDKLNEFDLIIFDRYRRSGVLPPVYLENIAQYVERGGALLEASGAGFATPLSLYHNGLSAVLPGEPTGRTLDRAFLPTITALGRRHPVTAGLPGDNPDGPPTWGHWFHQVEITPHGGAVVMAGADQSPLLVLKRTGKGRVAQLASDQIWLWSRGFEGGGPQAELLRRLAHWLMKEPELEENDLRARVDGRRITVERRSLDEAAPATTVPPTVPLTMTSPDGTRRTLPLNPDGPGRWTATVTAAEPGIHRFSDGVRQAVAVVGMINPPELTEVRTTPDKLKPVTQATGGGVVWLDDNRDNDQLPGATGYGGFALRSTDPDRPAAGNGWLGLRANDNHVVTGLSQTPLLPTGIALAAALLLLLGTWRREGK